MIRRSAPWLAAAFLAGVFLVGLPHWMPPSDHRGFGDPSMLCALAGLAAIAMMLVVGEIAPAWRAWLVMSLCLPVAAFAGVMMAPPSHDLWPLELAFSLGVGALAVLPGVLAGSLSRRLQQRGGS